MPSISRLLNPQDGMYRVLELDLRQQHFPARRPSRETPTNSATSLALPLSESLCVFALSLSPSLRFSLVRSLSLSVFGGGISKCVAVGHLRERSWSGGSVGCGCGGCGLRGFRRWWKVEVGLFTLVAGYRRFLSNGPGAAACMSAGRSIRTMRTRSRNAKIYSILSKLYCI